MQEIPISRQGDRKVYPDGKSGFPFLKNKLLSFYKILQANSTFCPANFYRTFNASTEIITWRSAGQNLAEGVQLRYAVWLSGRLKLVWGCSSGCFGCCLLCCARESVLFVSPVYFCKTTTLLFICRKSRFPARVTVRSTLTENRDFPF